MFVVFWIEFSYIGWPNMAQNDVSPFLCNIPNMWYLLYAVNLNWSKFCGGRIKLTCFNQTFVNKEIRESFTQMN